MSETEHKLREYLKKMRQYDHVLNLLYWDLETLAPKKGLDQRTEAIRYFSTESFRLSTADEYGRLLETLSRPEEFETLDPAMQLTVKRYLRDYRRFKRIPEDFYADFVEEKTRSGRAWEEAKRSSDYSLFAPHLQKIIDMTKQYAAYMEPDQDPYEVLLDQFEEGIDQETIDRVFGELKPGVVELIKNIGACPAPDLSALNGYYDIEAQKKVQALLLDYIGFDKEAGATAESEHPFTMELSVRDVRVTNHYLTDNPLSAMFTAIHEGGHAIFGQNIDPKYEDTAAGQVNLCGLHESQSRFFENILARRPSFWKPIYRQITELLPQLGNVPFETFCRAINDVHPSMIRTEADEVTYCMHIILRYEIERAIFRDNVTADELPALWNDKMEELLGIRPQNDAEGILQDVHWSDGSFGYFPSYLLGNVYDGLFLQALEKEKGSVDKILEEGRVREITAWLNENIHRNGSLYTSDEVIRRVCGSEITAGPLLSYFRKKYAAIYGFDKDVK